jgi:hypothetical protein
MSLKVLSYGTLTANFLVPVNISIPQQYLLPLYGLIPSFLIPSIAAWISARRRSKHFRECMREIEKLPDKIDYYNKDKYLQYTDTIKELKRESIIGILVGIALISLLPFMGLTCRWCTAAGS